MYEECDIVRGAKAGLHSRTRARTMRVLYKYPLFPSDIALARLRGGALLLAASYRWSRPFISLRVIPPTLPDRANNGSRIRRTMSSRVRRSLPLCVWRGCPSRTSDHDRSSRRNHLRAADNVSSSRRRPCAVRSLDSFLWSENATHGHVRRRRSVYTTSRRSMYITSSSHDTMDMQYTRRLACPTSARLSTHAPPCLARRPACLLARRPACLLTRRPA